MMKEGDRIELLHTDDPHTDLKAGDLGLVSFVDAMGTVHVDWDNGSNLGLIPGVDHFRPVST